MRNLGFSILLLIGWALSSVAQPCGVVQALSPMQQAQINAIISPLDTALTYENLYQIDSLSAVLKTIYDAQGGIPDAIENNFALLNNSNWLNLNQALLLSRQLIGADSLVYVNLWKAAKGMSPPAYQPHSLFLRASAEIAAGLLKIADNESDLTRKALYQLWATRALDSLATMQIQSGPCTGAFPFPDLRTYGDPVFSPIIQNFLNACGPDSVNVLQNGWLIDDKSTGEFKFDAGVIANAYYEAYQYTGNINYKNIAVAIGNYLKPLKFNLNYNYNTFVSLGLSRAFQLTNDTTFLNRAILNLRFAVYPGQIGSGRWVDGHNANSRYHSIIIQNSVSTVQHIPGGHLYKTVIDSMAYRAVKNMLDYTYTCNSATGYRWLMKAYTLDVSVIPNTLKDSIIHLIGQHINQSDSTGKYLDVPTMGEYLELLDLLSFTPKQSDFNGLEIQLFPNPTTGIINIKITVPGSEKLELTLSDLTGRMLIKIAQEQKEQGTYLYRFDLNDYPEGMYILNLKSKNGQLTKKILKMDGRRGDLNYNY